MPAIPSSIKTAAKNAASKALASLPNSAPRPSAICPNHAGSILGEISDLLFGKNNPLQQQQKDTCALMSARSILLEKKGKAPDENGMIPIGEKSGAYKKCEGTVNEAAVLNQIGIPATQVLSPSLEDIAKAVNQGKGVIVSYDTRPVWGGMHLKNPKPLGHAVRVNGVERDKDGKVSALHIIDSGNGTEKWIPAATFQKGLDGFGGGRMAVTNEPLHMRGDFEPSKRRFA